jgi:hypothetical protein
MTSRSWIRRMLAFTVLIGSCVPVIPLAIPPRIGATVEEQFSYLSTIVSSFDCDLDRLLDHLHAESRTFVAELTGQAVQGGFGAQLCLHWIPRIITALCYGSKLSLDIESPWNYGCPEHETPFDVLVHAKPFNNIKDEVYHKFSSKEPAPILGSKTMQFPSPLLCHGEEITPLMLRSAVANYYLTFQPFFEEKIRNEILKLKLPHNILAVHVRGGDKLVSEWQGSGGLADPQLWALKMKTVINNERKQYQSDMLDSTVFVESDDCNLLLEVKKALDNYGIKMIHIPCALTKPVLYIQKSHVKNITGHHQQNWNEGHSCDDTIKYFTGLTIFREAQAVLLGSGGDHGVPLAGTGMTSNTALLIEFLREGYNKNHPIKRTYNLQAKGYTRGTVKYPNGTFSVY